MFIMFKEFDLKMGVFKFKVLYLKKNIAIKAMNASSINEAESYIISLLCNYVNSAFEPQAVTEYGKAYLAKNDAERKFNLMIGGAFRFFVEVVSEDNSRINKGRGQNKKGNGTY
jgi:hypothetical protein